MAVTMTAEMESIRLWDSDEDEEDEMLGLETISQSSTPPQTLQRVIKILDAYFKTPTPAARAPSPSVIKPVPVVVANQQPSTSTEVHEVPEIWAAEEEEDNFDTMITTISLGGSECKKCPEPLRVRLASKTPARPALKLKVPLRKNAEAPKSLAAKESRPINRSPPKEQRRKTKEREVVAVPKVVPKVAVVSAEEPTAEAKEKKRLEKEKKKERKKREADELRKKAFKNEQEKKRLQRPPIPIGPKLSPRSDEKMRREQVLSKRIPLQKARKMASSSIHLHAIRKQQEKIAKQSGKKLTPEEIRRQVARELSRRLEAEKKEQETQKAKESQSKTKEIQGSRPRFPPIKTVIPDKPTARPVARSKPRVRVPLVLPTDRPHFFTWHPRHHFNCVDAPKTIVTVVQPLRKTTPLHRQGTIMLRALTIKSTKIINQTKLEKNALTKAKESDPPRFANRHRTKLFTDFIGYNDRKRYPGQRHDQKRPDNPHRKMVQMYDSELRNLQFRRQMELFYKNMAHMYLFLANSPYGDQASSTSDMIRGIVPPITFVCPFERRKPFARFLSSAHQLRVERQPMEPKIARIRKLLREKRFRNRWRTYVTRMSTLAKTNPYTFQREFRLADVNFWVKFDINKFRPPPRSHRDLRPFRRPPPLPPGPPPGQMALPPPPAPPRMPSFHTRMQAPPFPPRMPMPRFPPRAQMPIFPTRMKQPYFPPPSFRFPPPWQ